MIWQLDVADKENQDLSKENQGLKERLKKQGSPTSPEPPKGESPQRQDKAGDKVYADVSTQTYGVSGGPAKSAPKPATPRSPTYSEGKSTYAAPVYDKPPRKPGGEGDARVSGSELHGVGPVSTQDSIQSNE